MADHEAEAVAAVTEAIQVGWLPTLDAKWPREIAEVAVSIAERHLVIARQDAITELQVAVARLIGDLGELRERVDAITQQEGGT